MSKIKIDNYTFDKTAKTVTFTDYATIRLDGILLVVNATSNVIIFDFSNPLKGGTVSTNVLALTYDTSAMNNADKLLIYYDDVVDGRLVQSATINAAGVGTSYDTQGYGSMVAQVTGTWIGEFLMETSNDNVNWDMVFILSRDELSLQDNIDQNGTYSIKRSGRYQRYNCLYINGSATFKIVGRIGEGLNGADMISFAMDRQNNSPLQVQLPKDFKQDTTGALVPSDMVGGIVWQSTSVNAPLVIDCTGYQTVFIVKTTAGIVTPTVSNDNVNYFATVACGVGGLAAIAATIPTATGAYAIPVTAKYLKLTGPASTISCVVYLSQAPFNPMAWITNPPFNLTQIAGTAPVVTNIAGMLAVGGNIGAGVAPTANPLLMAGVDTTKTGALTRRILTDQYGRVIVTTAPSGSLPNISPLGYDTSWRNVVEVNDTDEDEDNNSQIYLESMMLKELKILNIYLAELPFAIANALSKAVATSTLDTPDVLRNDPSLFNN